MLCWVSQTEEKETLLFKMILPLGASGKFKHLNCGIRRDAAWGYDALLIDIFMTVSVHHICSVLYTYSHNISNVMTWGYHVAHNAGGQHSLALLWTQPLLALGMSQVMSIWLCAIIILFHSWKRVPQSLEKQFVWYVCAPFDEKYTQMRARES